MIAALALCAALVAGDDLPALEKKLKSSNDRDRASAVTELAKLGSKEAWTLVIDALRDPASNVGDEAESQLAKLNVPELVDDLLGKRGLLSSDEKVQLRAAGLLGSLEQGSLPGPKLAAGLAAKSANVRRTLRASLERLIGSGRVTAPDRLVGGLETWLKNTEDDEVRAAGLSALVRIPDHIPAAPVDLAREGDPPPVTCAILAMLAGAADPRTRAFLAKCSTSPEHSVRSQVVDTIVSKPDADGLKLLVAMFEHEHNRRIAWTIDGALEKLSGLSGGGKADFWRAWVDNLGPEWKPATGARPSAERAGETTAPKIVGFPIVSSAVAILVDFSGSTWEKRADGKTRKERLDVELQKALEALPPETLFNVIPYMTRPRTRVTADVVASDASDTTSPAAARGLATG